MEAANICPGRSSYAMKVHFLNHLSKRLGEFGVTVEQLKNADKRQEYDDKSSEETLNSRIFHSNKKYFTATEDQLIVDFILKNHDKDVNGSDVWKLMVESNIVEGHSWRSVKERFHASILARLDWFGLTTNQKLSLKARTGSKKQYRKRGSKRGHSDTSTS